MQHSTHLTKELYDQLPNAIHMWVVLHTIVGVSPYFNPAIARFKKCALLNLY